MSYLVLARKWRPTTFDSVVGQTHVTRVLRNAFAAGRIHHAYLFTGPRGVGKTSAARILARALNCKAADGPTADPCGSCDTCREISAGASVDVLEIDGASNTGVDDVRSLCENARYMPSSSRFKVYVIDEVHMLSKAAFNALLKTLEEPPPHVKFIFATTEPHKIPATVISRCQRFDFRRIAIDSIAQRLGEILSAEGVQADPQALRMVALESGGSMRDAQSLLDQIIAFSGQQVTRKDVEDVLGVIDRSLLFTTTRGILAGDADVVLQSLREVFERGHDLRQFADELTLQIRNLAVAAVASDADRLLDLTDADLLEVRELAALAEPQRFYRAFALLNDALPAIANADQPRLVLEMTLLRMCSLDPVQPLSEVLQRLDALAQGAPLPQAVPVPTRPAPPARPTTKPEPPKPEPPKPEPPKPEPPKPEPPKPEPPKPEPPKPEPPKPATDAAAPPTAWEQMLRGLEANHPAAAAQLANARVLALSPEEIVVSVDSAFSMETIRERGWDKVLAEAAQARMGVAVPVRLVLAGAPLPTESARPLTLREEERRRLAEHAERLRLRSLEHPGVKAALAVFPGSSVLKIVPDEREVQAASRRLTPDPKEST